MTMSRRKERELIREKYLALVADFLESINEDVLKVKSNEIAFPVIGVEGNEDFLVVTFKVPTGANKGTEPYDGYAMADDYAHSLAEKAEKEKKKAEAKAKKVKRDEEIRRKRAEIAEKNKA